MSNKKKFPYSLYLVTHSQHLTDLCLLDIVDYAVRFGFSCVQLREKELCTAEFIELARIMKSLLIKKSIPLFINDRVDVALASCADGIHVGQDDMSYRDIKKIIPPKMRIGMTIDYPSQIYSLNKMDLAYLGVSVIYPSTVKSDIKHFWKEHELKKLVLESEHPLIGIGGIDSSNAESVFNLGLDGIAVSSAICAQKSLCMVSEQTKKLSKIAKKYCVS